jgi:hypothetical protein
MPLDLLLSSSSALHWRAEELDSLDEFRTFGPEFVMHRDNDLWLSMEQYSTEEGGLRWMSSLGRSR